MAGINHDNIHKNQMEKLEKMNRKQTIMTIYLTFFSIIVYLAEFSANIIIFFYPFNPLFLFSAEFCICFLIVFKQIMNFIFFYLFNSNFKKYIRFYLNLKR